jgi:type I restriction enzyme S subunit
MVMTSAAVARKDFVQTDLGIFPSDWRIVTLNAITTMMTNGFVGAATKHYAENENGILYIQGYNVEANSFNFHGIKYVTEHFHRNHKKSSLRTNDLLTVQTGDVGLTTIVPPTLEGSNCHALIISRFDQKKVSPKYVSYYLNSSIGRARLRLIETGTTMKHLNVSDMLQFELPIPATRQEQEAIAEALSDADLLIESLEALIAKKRAIKQGAMQDLLSGRKRLPGFAQVWERTTLGSQARIQRGASPRPIDDPIWFDDNSSIGWVRISDVTSSGMFLLETSQRLSDAGVRKSRFVPSESLIMSICATVGRPIITKLDVCIHDGFVVFDEIRGNRDFLYYILQSIEPEWSRHGQTGSQMNLNTGLIQRTELDLPPDVNEQEQIARILRDVDESIARLELRLNKALMIKQAMMQELLMGRIRLV